jgi:HEAT repeat protein
MICAGILLITLAGSPLPQEISSAFVQSFQAHPQARQNADYQKGLRALDARQWDEAISAFTACAAQKGDSADAALYWKAYAENREALGQQALSTLAQLRQIYPDSRWVHDAQALALEIRAQAGNQVNPSTEPDDNLKLIALNSLMQSEPDKALPILQKLLAGNNSEKLKERALFVLTQNRSPEAHKLLAGIARGTTDPGLQIKAIRYMGMMGGEESRKDLADIYSSSSDERVKQAILQGFMLSRSRPFLLNIAKTEKDPTLRRDAIRMLAMSGGRDELWQLYQTETSVENKKAILESMFLGHNFSKLVEIARNEKDPELRVAAIRSLGLMKDNSSADVLVSIYQSDPNRQVREAVLNALFLQRNGKALVDLARSEKDPAMKKRIVERMALLHTKETTDYMMEVLQ